MADQKNRGGQKTGNQQPDDPQQHQGVKPETAGGERSDRDKQEDRRTNPDDARRQPTDQQR